MNDVLRLDAQTIAQAFLAHWRLLVVLPVLVGLGVATAGPMVPPTYRSQAKVLVQESVAANPFLEEMLVDWSLKQRMPVIQSVLMSHRTLKQVLEDLGELAPDATAEDADRAVDDFRRRVNVYSMGGGIVNISLRGSSPAGVERGLTALVDRFVHEILKPQTESVERSASFLAEQIERVREELFEAEERIRVFKQENAGELPEVYRINLDTLLVLRQELATAELEYEDGLRRRKLLEERLASFDPVAGELESQLIHSEARAELLLAVYTPEHPEVRANAAQISKLRRATKKRSRGRGAIDIDALENLARGRRLPGPDGEIGSSDGSDLLTSELLRYKDLMAKIHGMEARKEVLGRQIDEANAAVRAHAGNEKDLNRFLRDVEIKSTVYTDLLAKYEEALVTRELSLVDEGSQVWLVDPPRRPGRHDGFPLPVLVFLGCLGGLVLGTAATVLLELTSPLVRTPREASRIAGVPLVTVIPLSVRLDGASAERGKS